MSIHPIPVRTIDGRDTDLSEHAGRALLIVNVASKCGFTPQYKGLQALWEQYEDRGLTVLGFPCNQFLEQEPGSNQEIVEFCSMTFGVTFPLYEKIEVTGPGRHPLFERLAEVPDGDGEAGDVKWNFEKWVVGPDGGPVQRFRTQITPEDPALVATIEKQLPA